ncbi:hypothetical protein FKM82_010368 [Ascaphus truei]
MLCLNMAGCRRRTEEAPRTSNPSSAYSWPFHLESSAIFFVVMTVLAGVPGLCTAQGPQISSVTAVTSSNWTVILQGEWMVKFYAPWCPACQQIQSEWESFGKKSHALDVNVGKVDVTQEPGLSGRFFVTTLPTIFHAKDGVFRKYRGSRMVEDLQAFISEKKWEVVEPIAGWKSPSSIIPVQTGTVPGTPGHLIALAIFEGCLEWPVFFIYQDGFGKFTTTSQVLSEFLLGVLTSSLL